MQAVEQLSTLTRRESVSNLTFGLLFVAADVDIITMHIVRYRLVLRPCLGGPGDDRDRQLLLRSTSRRMRLVLVFSFPIEFSTCSSPLLAHDRKYPQYSYAFSRAALRFDFGTYNTFRVMGS
jgi:hypothetical protein